MSWKPYGSASAWIFFTETIFLTNFKWFSGTRRVEHFCSSLLPLFIGKWRRSLPPSSPKRARLLPSDGTAFWRTSWKAQVGLVAICTPPCLLNTPPCLFCWFFFRNVTELYKLHNDTCFLSVMSRNLMDYVIIPSLASGMLRNFMDGALTLPFDFRHVTELHGLCNNAFFLLPAYHGTSRID